jgi:integrase
LISGTRQSAEYGEVLSRYPENAHLEGARVCRQAIEVNRRQRCRGDAKQRGESPPRYFGGMSLGNGRARQRWRIKPQTFSNKNWPKLLARAGVKHRRFYQCRHTFATLLLQAGADWQYVADQMGHANLKMLLDHYWKWRPGSTRKPQTDLLAGIIGK